MIDTVDGLFRAAAARHPERTFIRSLGDPELDGLTYAHAAEKIRAIVESMNERGIRAGDRVVVYATAIEPSVLFFLACASCGVLPAPIPESASIAKLEEAIADLKPRAVFALPSRLEELAGLGVPVHSLRLFAGGATGDALAWLDQISQAHGPADPYMLQPTSGTTGRSKYVIRPHAAFVRAARVIANEHGEGRSDRILVIAALTHGMGQYLLSIATLLGGTITVPAKIGTESSLEEIRALDPTFLAMPPRVLRALFAQWRNAPSDRIFGPSAETINVSGAASDAELLSELERQGIAVVEGYGASEFSLVAVTPRGQWREGHLGRILPDVEVRIDEDGELLAKTPGMMHGYFGAPELTAAAFTDDGFFRCGDLCEITPDGWLRYLGRKRDVFNTYAGNNIHPTRIEEMLEQLPFVHQAVLFGDQKPFLIALLTLKDPIEEPAELGHLDPARHAELYRRASEEITALNAGLEQDERIRRFALFGRAMRDELYAIVGHGKTRRDRAAIGRVYARIVGGLYENDPTCGREVT